MKLSALIEQKGLKGFVFADLGNGSSFGEVAEFGAIGGWDKL